MLTMASCVFSAWYMGSSPRLGSVFLVMWFTFNIYGKAACPSKQIPEGTLEKAAAEGLGPAATTGIWLCRLMVAGMTVTALAAGMISSPVLSRAAADHHVLAGPGGEPLHFGERDLGPEKAVRGWQGQSPQSVPHNW